jgi:site-specific recombinase XerD
MKYSKRRKDLQRQQDEQQQSKTSFEQALSAFLEAQDAAGHSKVTQSDYGRVLRGVFLRYMTETYGYACIQDITERDLIGWLAYLRNATNKLGRAYSSRSIQTYYTYVLAFFHWLVEHGYLEENPLKSVKLPKADKPLIRVFTEDELMRLDLACDRLSHGRSLTSDERKALAARDRAILWMLLSTGVRLSELCGLRLRDIDWKQGMIYIRGKGAKERKVPFGSVARQHLNTYLQYWRGDPLDPVNEHVFLSVFGKPLSDNAVQRMFKRLAERANIHDKRVSAHTCRHWFAVNAIKQGMPTAALRDLLGHETWEMIDVYVHLAEQDKKDIYVKFSPVDSLKMHQTTRGRRGQIREWRNARKQAKGD